VPWVSIAAASSPSMTASPANARCRCVHALHRCAMRRGLPVSCFYTTRRRGAALQDLCMAALLLLRLSVGAPQYRSRQLRFARQDGQVHLLRRRPGSRLHAGRIRQIRRQPACRGKLPICAEMCSTKSLLAGDGAIIAEIYKERVMKRGYDRACGLEDRLRGFTDRLMQLQ